MDSIAPVNGAGPTIDEAARIKLQDAYRGAAESLETPHDVMLRLFNTALEVPMVKAGCDLGIFKALAESEKPLSVEKLAEPSGAEPLLLGRIVRYLASIRLVTETGRDQFHYNNATKALANPSIQGAIYYIFNIGGPAYQALPDHLQETKYQSHTGGKYAWHRGFNTELDFFPWASQYPEKLRWFQQLMSVPREGDWFDVAPFTQEVSPFNPERAHFVDVGGSIGHQCARLKAKYPNLPGRIILQDLPETIKAARPIEGVEFMAHDFFKPQPVKDAKYYYLRTVLHDWDDEKSLEILKNLIPALGPDSQILIDDMVLPNTGVHWFPACLDLHMLTMLGARERNVDQWHSLLDRAGLKVVEIQTYMPTMRHSLITAALK